VEGLFGTRAVAKQSSEATQAALEVGPG
jgi:hypothetical protein